MRQSGRMVIVLVVVGMISGLFLAGVYNYTAPLIKENEKKALEEGIYKVLPDASRYTVIAKDGITLYHGLDAQDRVVGYAFEAEGYGYQGVIKIMAGIDPQLHRLTGMEVLQSSETPGLGAEIAHDPFKSQFRGLAVLPNIIFTKDKAMQDNEIEAITGATISTRAVVEILNKEIAKIREIFKK